jgi:alpha,alpha-trehalase
MPAAGPTIEPGILRQCALIADGERGALVGSRGEIMWLCVPHWDSPAAFSGLLAGRGRYVANPADPWHAWSGYYEPGTLIWRNRWVGDVTTECREALAMPADPHRTVVLHRIEAVDGPARINVALDVSAGYGNSGMTGLSREDRYWTGRSDNIQFRWSGAARARHTAYGLSMTLDLAEGEHYDLVLELSDQALPAEPVQPDMAWMGTEEAWSRVVPDCSDLIAVADARHAYAVLHGLTSASGAMVAAATTSLPERLKGGGSHDYRYAWIRDQCYSGLAVAAHGPNPLLGGTVKFVTERLLADGPGLMPAYTVTGEAIPCGETLPLRGFPGGTAVTGNRVREQFQLDTFGDSLALLAAAARLDMLGEDDWRAAAIAADAIKKRWREPDAGIWELGGKRWAQSRLACVAGLRLIAAVAAEGPIGGHGRREAAHWSSLADTILASLGDCVHPSGRWQRAPDDERVDASLLLPVIRGALPPDDPRMLQTVATVREELGVDGFVYRFRRDARPLNKAEGAFLLCGFWMALVEHAYGNPVAAAHWFERNRAVYGPAALYAEEYDVHQRQLRGNLPQAFVHAAMLECAVTLSRDVVLGKLAFTSGLRSLAVLK